MLQLEAIPSFADNYIWLLADAEHLAIVDPGDAEPVLRRLQALGRKPSAVLITHHHADHIGGVAALLARWPELIIHAPADQRIPLATDRVRDGDQVAKGLPLPFEVIEVPGHTLSHVAYVARPKGETPILFCGDTLFSLGCGRLFEGTPAQMHASLQRLASLEDDCRVCCAHEYTESNLRFLQSFAPAIPALAGFARELQQTRRQGQPSLPSSLALERRLNPFLAPGNAEWRKVLLPGLSLGEQSSELDLFTALRRAKDQFA